MEKKRDYFGVFLIGVIIVATTHSVSYAFLVFTDNSLPQTNPLSGFVIQKSNDGTQEFSLSGILIILEWAIAITGTSYVLARKRIDISNEVTNLYLTKKKYTSSNTHTDIDVLYSILKERRQLKLAAISKVFGVPEETALEWAKILEKGNLANIYYPQIGEPELLIGK